MAESKIKKYTAYALGEIILVMIGILLALQVNNWNEANQRNATEIKLLRELLVNLRNDSIDNAINSKWYVNVTNSANIINRHLDENLPWHDSLSRHFGTLYSHGIATLNISAYENLKSIGFDLISNDSIRIALTNLHSISYELVRKTEEEFAKDNFNQVIVPVLVSRLRMDRWFDATPHNYEALMDDLEFQETVRWRGITMGYVGSNTRDANRRVIRLIRMIERELRKRTQE